MEAISQAQVVRFHHIFNTCHVGRSPFRLSWNMLEPKHTIQAILINTMCIYLLDTADSVWECLGDGSPLAKIRYR